MTIDIKTLALEIARHVPPVQPWPRWMSLKLAAQYSGYGEKKLIELADPENKKIIGFRDPELKTSAWIFDKESIDRYRTEQAMLADHSDDALARRKKIIAILDRRGI